MHYQRQSFVPAGARKVAHKGSSAVVYLYEKAGVPYVVGFAGKAQKPAMHYSFRKGGEKGRERCVREFFGRIETRETYATARKAERAAKLAAPHKLQVGHIMACSWGWEQTNVDFYEVVALVGKRGVMLQKLSSVASEDLSLQGTCTPGEARVGEPFRKLVDEDNGVRLTSYSWAKLWEGKPLRWSAYA